MKQIILIGIFYLSFIISAIWAVVEFILYLVKDDPFNWNSVWCTIIGFVFMIIAFVMKAAMMEREHKKMFSNNRKTFDERMKEFKR